MIPMSVYLKKKKKEETVCVHKIKKNLVGGKAQIHALLAKSSRESSPEEPCSEDPEQSVSHPLNTESISGKETAVHLVNWNSLKMMSKSEKYGSLMSGYSPKNSHVPGIYLEN